MLTREVINKNEHLKDLTEEQFSAIETLSKADENEVISAKTLKIYSDLDADIKETFGVDRETNEKTYNYLKRAGKSIVEAKADLEANAATFEAKEAEYKAQIKNGSADAAIKAENDRLINELATVREDFTEQINVLNTSISDRDKAAYDRDVQMDITSGMPTFVFNDTLNPEVRKVFIDSQISAIATDYEVIRDADNNLQYKDKSTGKLALNPSKELRPFTGSELLANRLEPILKSGKPSTGTGGKPLAPGAKGGTFAITATTRPEAVKQIKTHLIESGKFERGTRAFTAEQAKIAKENAIDKLPMAEAVN